MNQADVLKALLAERLPDASVSVSNAAPEHPNGSWFVDVRLGKRMIVAEWSPSVGIALSSSDEDDGLGSGHHEFYENGHEAAERIVTLLSGGERTVPPSQATLRRLRESRRFSQVDLASLMGITQTTLSKMERRDDWNLSTIRRFVEALGGQLEVRARFGDHITEIVDGSMQPADDRPARRAS